MSKSWVAALALLLGLSRALLSAAEPPDATTPPPGGVKLGPLPLDTKAPPALPAPTAVHPAPAATPGPCVCAPAVCTTEPAPCKPSLRERLHALLPGGCGCCGSCGDRPCLRHLLAWATFCPGHLSEPSCGCGGYPWPHPYTYFHSPGCAERCGVLGYGGPGANCNTCGSCNFACPSCARGFSFPTGVGYGLMPH